MTASTKKESETQTYGGEEGLVNEKGKTLRSPERRKMKFAFEVCVGNAEHDNRSFLQQL